MEALAAIGLASAIVQFVDFSSTLVSGAREIYSSASGAKTESDAADQSIDRLRDLTRRLPRIVLTAAMTPDEKRLVALKDGCHDVSHELGEILGAGRAKTPGSKRASLRASWNTIRNTKKVANLQSRLDRYRAEVLGVLQAMMSDDVSEIKGYLDSLIEAQPKYAESLREELGRTRNSIIKAIQAESQASQNEQHIRADEQQASLEQIHKDLAHLLETTKVIPAQDAVLDMLWFESITTRQRSINPAHEATFRWLLDQLEPDRSTSGDETERSDSDFGDKTKDIETYSSKLRREREEQEALKRFENRKAFLDWLRVGSGVFYISGKAGAGKSTLMKFLSQEEKTHRELQAWAEDDRRRLILARFFFWNSGDQLQKSLEGLYRTMLWDILRQFPDLIPHAFPDAWSAATSKGNKNTRHHPSFHVELQDLHDALDRLFTSPVTRLQYKLCLFIDGLDEFDGDYWNLSQAISSWATMNSVKFCVSSRPHNEFMTMFASDPSRHLRLHELTRQDMLKFVQSEFQGDERSAAIKAETHYYFSLIDDIVKRADGIFLWVGLVTYEMLKAMGNHSSPVQLRQRLDSIPKGLDGIFIRMFDAIDGPDRRRAAQMLLIMKLEPSEDLNAPNRWVYTHSMMDEIIDNPQMLEAIFSGKTGPPMMSATWEPSSQVTAARLIARCNGLVEVAPLNSGRLELSDFKLQFIHRSVSDFLDDEDIHGEILKLAGGFCPWTAFVHSMLVLLKVFGLYHLDTGYTIDSILRACATAESMGLPPFTKEMGALIHICRQLAKADENGCISIVVHHFGIERTRLLFDSAHYLETPSDDIDSTILSQGILRGCINPCLERVAQDMALMTPRPRTNILLVTAMVDLRIAGSPHRSSSGKARHAPGRAVPTDLMIHRILSIDPSSINAPSFSCRRDSELEYFPNPSWTTWTTFLFVLWYRVLHLHKIKDNPERHQEYGFGKQKISNMIQLFLEHDADASVCFVFCDWNRYIQIRDGTQQLEEFDTRDIVSFATMPAVVESWGIPLGSKTRQLMNQHAQRYGSVWNVARVINFFKATETPKVNIRQLSSQDLVSGDLILIKVVAFTQLQDIKDEVIKEELEWQYMNPGWHDEDDPLQRLRLPRIYC